MAYIIHTLSLILLFNCLTMTGASYAATSVTQHGITWTFNDDYTIGQFVNGDFWVLGKGEEKCVTITEISNSRHSGLDLSTVDYDGSMVDVDRDATTSTHGFDSNVEGYLTSRNINKSLPQSVCGNKSILSSISWLNSDPDLPVGWVADRPRLKRIAILTVVDSTPSVTHFRPSYAITNKSLYDSAGIDVDSLPRLSPVEGMRTLETYSSWVTGPWTDILPPYASEFLRPSDNYPYNPGKDGTYGRYVASAYGDALLAAMVDQSQVGDKTQLVINLIQIGIDYYGMYLNGASWPADGGHRHGYKLPILFSGKMLNHSGMLSVGNATLGSFQEDNHFYVSAEDVATEHCGDYNGCPPPCGDFGLMITDVTDRQYSSADIGIPEWGVRHTEDRCRDDRKADARYRETNGLSLSSHALAARILRLLPQWNNNAFFDYHDRWVNEINNGGGIDGEFATNMWGTYRRLYGRRLFRNVRLHTEVEP